MNNTAYRYLVTFLVVLFSLTLGACASSMKSDNMEADTMDTMDTMDAMDKPSLYQRLGGKDAIVVVVDEFVGNVAADDRINHYFANTDIPHLKRMLVDQICAATGGPCTYTGRAMKPLHEGMGITDADFNAMVEDLIKAMNDLNVPQAEQQELLGILGPMKSDIVEA